MEITEFYIQVGLEKKTQEKKRWGGGLSWILLYYDTVILGNTHIREPLYQVTVVLDYTYIRYWLYQVTVVLLYYYIVF